MRNGIAGSLLGSGRWTLWVVVSSQDRVLVTRETSMPRPVWSARAYGVYLCTCVPLSGQWVPHPTRLETRTKESDMRASQRVWKPVKAKGS